MKRLIVFFLLVSAIFAQSTKVGGSGATKVGGSGTTKVSAVVSGSFSPSTLTGLILWLEDNNDAASTTNTQYYTDSGSTLASVNDARIAQWNDLSGGNNHVTQATNKPYYKTALQNSHVGLSYYDGSDAMWLDSTQANNQKPVTFACVVRVTNVATDNTIFGGTTGSGSISFDVSSSRFRLLSQATTLIGTNGTNIANSTYYIVIVTYDSSGNYAFTVNGASDGSGTTNLTFTNGGTRIGANPGAGTAPPFLTGNTLAIIKCSAVLTGTEITNLNNYWRTKFNVY